jgi:general secretion pathway protein D
MRPVFNFNARVLLLSVTTAAFLISPASADCTYELFNIASVKGTSVGEFIDQISDECAISVIVADPEAENILKKQMNKTYLKNLTINEVLDLIIKDNNLQYTLTNNVLKISYLNTKTYNIDYIISQRKGEGSANITLSSQTSTASSIGSAGGSTGGSAAGGAKGGASSLSGINITSSDEVLFWEMLDKEIESILNRPEDGYTAAIPMINKNAGLITVTATASQLTRLDTYLNDLQKKMQAQVLIDVKMYSVTFSDGSTTGIDWSQLYALQNVSLGFDYANTKNIDKTYTGTNSAKSKGVLFDAFTANASNASVFQLSAGGSLNEVIKFLKTQGDVSAISNPKILTLNNQTALITAGTELFYSIDSSTTTAGGGAAPIVGNSRTVSSVFSGVLLDITPEISTDGTIILRVNPSISETASVVSADNKERTMPPDLSRRQMSSVISVKDGNRVILGGLINTKTSLDGNKIPLLGDIPYLGYLFKTETKSKQTQEIVIIIEPHIIKKEGNNPTLSDLGYARMDAAIEKDNISKSEQRKSDTKELQELKKDAK